MTRPKKKRNDPRIFGSRHHIFVCNYVGKIIIIIIIIILMFPFSFFLHLFGLSSLSISSSSSSSCYSPSSPELPISLPLLLFLGSPASRLAISSYTLTGVPKWEKSLFWIYRLEWITFDFSSTFTFLGCSFLPHRNLVYYYFFFHLPSNTCTPNRKKKTLKLLSRQRRRRHFQCARLYRFGT